MRPSYMTGPALGRVYSTVSHCPALVSAQSQVHLLHLPLARDGCSLRSRRAEDFQFCGGNEFSSRTKTPHTHTYTHTSGERCAAEFCPRRGFAVRRRARRAQELQRLAVHLPGGSGARPPPPTPEALGDEEGAKSPFRPPSRAASCCTPSPLPPVCPPRRHRRRDKAAQPAPPGERDPPAPPQPPGPWGGSAPAVGTESSRPPTPPSPGVAGKPLGVPGDAVRCRAEPRTALRGRAPQGGGRRRKSSPITPSAVGKHHGRGSPHRRRLFFVGGGKKPK